MISVVTWKWGSTFGPEYVNRMASMLRRNLRMEHRVHCITDNAAGIDRDIISLPLPAEFAGTPRCRRRMKQYDRAYASMLGSRILSIDLDVVIADDITSLVDRAEPVVLWKVGYAGVYSGSFVLYDAAALDGLYRAYAADPARYLKATQSTGTPSDQACLNHYYGGRPVPHWTERDGFVTWFGQGYADREHHGMGPSRHALTAGARIVVLGSADKSVMDSGAYPWVTAHWR